jgi:3-hydroxybutyryl-CoA dehydratase
MIEGDRFNHSFTVSQNVYRGFIDVFNDRNPLHTDDNWAKANGFKGKVMHGNILNGFISFFVGECLPMKNVIIYTQHIRFSQPVYLDDTLDFSAEITGVFESVNTYEFKFTFRNMEEKRVAYGTIQIGLLT